MFSSLLRFFRAKTRSTAILIGVASVAVLALSGWALAGSGQGRATFGLTSLMSALRDTHSSATTVTGNASPADRAQAPGAQAGRPGDGASQATGPQGASPLIAVPQGFAAENPLGDRPSAAEHSATGGGSASDFHFGFSAQSHPNGNLAGTVTGEAEFSFRPAFSDEIHVAVNCLEIVGSDAFVSGTLTRAAFGLTQGTEILFGVRDDDSAAKPDLISDIFFSPAPPFTCHTFHATRHFAVQGTIEIH